MDFFTVDTMLGKRFYVFAMISHKTREIIQFAITENPTREFVRQQLMLFTESIAGSAYLIHDNALMFNIDYLAYTLVSVRTGVEAPNMKAYASYCTSSGVIDNSLSICFRYACL